MVQTQVDRKRAGGQGAKTLPEPANKPKKDALKTSLKGASFDEGSALVSPDADKPPARPKSSLPPTDKGKQEATDKGKQEAKTDLHGVPIGTPVDKQARLAEWCEAGVDDPDAVLYVCEMKATPDKVGDCVQKAFNELDRMVKDKRPDVYKRLSKVMKDEDIAALMLYTTSAAYAMNAILRGQLKSARWVDAWGPLVEHAQRALKMMPKGARNLQHKLRKDDPTMMLDQSAKPDKIVPFKTVYRADKWNGIFDGLFASDYQVGATIEEPAFLSTSTIPNCYIPDLPIQRTIEDVKTARSISDLSMLQYENEAMLPPGSRFQIVSMELQDTKRGSRISVKNATALYPKRDGGPQAFNRAGLVWHVKLKQVGPPKKGEGKKGPADKDDKKNKKGDTQADKASGGGGIAELFGL